MSTYILVENGEFVREIELHTEFPNLSFPVNTRQEDLPENIIKVEDTPYPMNPLAKVSGYEIMKIADKWMRVWTTEPLVSLELSLAYEEQWKTIRAHRDQLMAMFEWRYTRYEREIRLEMPTTDSMEKLDEYMQALADITKQEDPFNITWPTQP